MAKLSEEIQKNPGLLSPITLAFMGDAVFEILVREYLVSQGSQPAGELHKQSVEMVRASAQAKDIDRLMDILSEQEIAIYKRGRNCNSVHPPKSADPSDYRKATGLEALFGYLYLCHNNERIQELFEIITNPNKENQP